MATDTVSGCISPAVVFLRSKTEKALALIVCYLQDYQPIGVLDSQCFANDEEEEDEDNCYSEALLEKSMVKPGSLHADDHWKCCPLRGIHVGSRQRLVILVSVLVFVLMIGFALLIWIGKGKGPIDSSVVARVYLDLFSIAILLLGGALACYGLLLYLKMSRVRSERTTEMWKVGGLAVVSLVCFTSCAIVALATNVPIPDACMFASIPAKTAKFVPPV
ncbi:hypothetical protein ACLOJK_008440 [Asimina triloba]